MIQCNYRKIVEECEFDFAKYGDTFEGVGWTKKKEYADLRYRVMLDVIRPESRKPVSLLDFGCGASHLLEYIIRHRIEGVEYAGLDLSDRYLSLCRQKFPDITYHKADLLDPSIAIPRYGYIVLNGVFTYKGEESHSVMWDYCRALLLRVAQFCHEGFAFNVMSKHLDWERDDLFHLPFEEVAAFLDKSISRHFSIRHDYGLFEYTVYVYNEPLSKFY